MVLSVTVNGAPTVNKGGYLYTPSVIGGANWKLIMSLKGVALCMLQSIHSEEKSFSSQPMGTTRPV
jgi:hypothetical protein